MLLLGVAIFCADFAFQSPVTTHRAALIFSYLACPGHAQRLTRER